MADPITDVKLTPTQEQSTIQSGGEASLIPEGFEKIPGSLNTTELQQAEFENIRPVGEIGSSGSFLIGQKRTLALPDGNITADAAGQVQDGGEALTGGPLGVTGAGDISATSQAGTTTDAITEFLKQNRADNLALQQQILAASQPTEREQELQKRLDELTSSRDLGLVTAEGRPIPLEFITGQQAQIERRAAALAQPLNQELERIVRARTGNLDVLTKQLGFQGANQALQFQVLQEARKPAMEAEQDVRSFILNMATKYPDAGITLDDSLESASRKVASSPSYTEKTSDLSSYPSSYQEWTLAGQPGSYADWLLKKGGTTRLTSDQLQAKGFADRMQESMSVFDSLESYISGLSVSQFYAQKLLPNPLKSPQFQQQEQAQRNFINAVLRRESGAAIAESEFESAAQQYFPQPGDSPEVLKQKKLNRATALNSLLLASGGTDSGGEGEFNW